MIADPAEYAGRLQRVHERMRTQSLSALVVCDPANIFYLTDRKSVV